MVQYLFVYSFVGLRHIFITVRGISQMVVLWAEETSTYSWSRFCTLNCHTLVSNYQLSHIRSGV